MTYGVILSEEVVHALRGMDAAAAARIYSWIGKNLEGCEDSRKTGKALAGDRSGEWRYRVGDYRLLARIEEGAVTVFGFEVGHRSNVYD